VISSFRHGANEFFALLRRYAASIGSQLSACRDSLSFISSRVKQWTPIPLKTGKIGYLGRTPLPWKIGRIGCLERNALPWKIRITRCPGRTALPWKIGIIGCPGRTSLLWKIRKDRLSRKDCFTLVDRKDIGCYGRTPLPWKIERYAVLEGLLYPGRQE
jgi:hypothetical protein